MVLLIETDRRASGHVGSSRRVAFRTELLMTGGRSHRVEIWLVSVRCRVSVLHDPILDLALTVATSLQLLPSVLESSQALSWWMKSKSADRTDRRRFFLGVDWREGVDSRLIEVRIHHLSWLRRRTHPRWAGVEIGEAPFPIYEIGGRGSTSPNGRFSGRRSRRRGRRPTCGASHRLIAAGRCQHMRRTSRSCRPPAVWQRNEGGWERRMRWWRLGGRLCGSSGCRGRRLCSDSGRRGGRLSSWWYLDRHMSRGSSSTQGSQRFRLRFFRFRLRFCRLLLSGPI